MQILVLLSTLKTLTSPLAESYKSNIAKTCSFNYITSDLH